MLRLAAAFSAVLALTLTGPVAAASAKGPVRVLSAHAYFTKKADGLDRRIVWVAFRMKRLLSADQLDADASPGGYLYLISRSERCYGMWFDVEGKRPRRVRVKLGPNAKWLDARLPVHPVRPGYGQGGALGCTRDREASVFVTNLSPQPLVAPRDLFFAANNGPRIVDIDWYGWGSPRAVGYGSYMARVPGSEGSEEELDVRPARLILTRPRMDLDYGAKTYTCWKQITWDGRYKRHVERTGKC